MKNLLVEPYSDVVNGEKVFMTSAVYTVVKDNKFLGVIGVDMSLDQVKEMVSKVMPFEDTRAYLLTDTQVVVSSPDVDSLMKPFEGPEEVMALIKEAKIQSIELKSNNGANSLYITIPVPIYNLEQQWLLVLETPMSTILAPAYKGIQKQAACSVVALIILMLTVFFSAKRSSGKISQLSNNLTDSASLISNSIAQLNETGSELADSSTAAAASIEETAASLEEITSMVKLNTENAQLAAQLSQESVGLAQTGEEEIKKLILTMNGIESSSQKIEEIISIIDDIAFQTNLLALNASVEAARAGEHGKGFAVVADAVRSLAQRSASAAKDISTLILTSVQQIKNGTKTAQENGEVLHKISISIDKVSQLNKEIAAASLEQSTGINLISTSINDIDSMVQKNASQAEEIVNTAGEIEEKSHVMTSTVKVLNGEVA